MEELVKLEGRLRGFAHGVGEGIIHGEGHGQDATHKYTHPHPPTHKCTHARTHARARTHTHTWGESVVVGEVRVGGDRERGKEEGNVGVRLRCTCEPRQSHSRES
jgi:hypothetical protein